MKEFLGKFKGQKIAVIGDVMLDRYLWGEVNRISPEAPVPVVLMKQETIVPGGAGNTANNIAALSGEAEIISVIGNDHAGKLLSSEFQKLGIKDGLVTDNSRPTIQKTRVMGNKQQIIRMDKEKTNPIDANISKKIIDKIKTSKATVHVLSDYAKGTITDEIIKEINLMKTKLICDGKPKNKQWFKNCYLITPNKKEAYEMAGANDKASVESVGRILAKELNCNVLMTLADKGMTLFEKEGKITHIPAKAKEVYDVSGAGDTVVATAALALSAGAGLIDACKIANYAAGIVVGKLGTATTTIDEIKMAMEINDEN